jgi:LPS sulfotransferase NodH
MQVSGWARSDMLCLEQLPWCTFGALPNWCDLTLALLAAVPLGAPPHLALLPPGVEIALSFTTCFARVESPRAVGVGRRVAIALLATLPSMIQDVTRLQSKLERLRFAQLCQHFDWMDGGSDRVRAMQAALMLKLAVVAAVGVIVQLHTAAMAIATPWAATAATTAASVLLPHRMRLFGAPIPPRDVLGGLKFVDSLTDTPFAVLASQRTGSNALLGDLQRHPQIQVHNEIFNERYVFGRELAQSTTARDAEPGAFLHAALRAHSEAHLAVGFKLFPEHIRRSDAHHVLFERMLADTRVRKVVLKRENRLAVCTSMLRASTTGAYTFKNYDAVRVVISPSDLQRTIDTYDGYYAWLDERLVGQTVCRLSYEALDAAPDDALAEVYKFLGVPPPSAQLARKTCLTRQSTSSLRDAIANFDELEAVFAGTERACDFAS